MRKCTGERSIRGISQTGAIAGDGADHTPGLSIDVHVYGDSAYTSTSGNVHFFRGGFAACVCRYALSFWHSP